MTEIEKTNGIDRRTVVKGAAWSVPVIAAAVATPLAAASHEPGHRGLIDLDAGCIQVAGAQLVPGFSLNNVGTATYTTAADGTITVTETIDLTRVTLDPSFSFTNGLSWGNAGLASAAARTSLWAVMLVEGIASGSTAGVSTGDWEAGASASGVPLTYSRTVTFTGAIPVGGAARWGNLLDVTQIVNLVTNAIPSRPSWIPSWAWVLPDANISWVQRYATVTAPVGNPPIVDAGPSDLSFAVIGGC